LALAVEQFVQVTLNGYLVYQNTGVLHFKT